MFSEDIEVRHWLKMAWINLKCFVKQNEIKREKSIHRAITDYNWFILIYLKLSKSTANKAEVWDQKEEEISH